MMIIIVVACLVFPIISANSFLILENVKKQQEEKEVKEVEQVKEVKQIKEVYLFATGYYHPEEDQDFYATDSYEEDLELNGRGITASGKKVKRGHVAVDPSVIPLGTVFHTEKYGILTAEDTGGRIKGKRIDIFAGDGQNGLIKALKIRGWLKLKILKWGTHEVSV